MLTFNEFPQLRFLLQPGLQVQELAVAPVDRVVRHLLEAVGVLTLQRCLILGRKRADH